MRPLRIISFWLLLLPMVFVLLPRDLVHAALHEVDRAGHGDEGAGHHGAGTSDGASTIEAACALCAVDMLVAVPVAVDGELLHMPLALPRFEADALARDLFGVAVPADRGPPACA